jgi:hypothetical protein
MESWKQLVNARVSLAKEKAEWRGSNGGRSGVTDRLALISFLTLDDEGRTGGEWRSNC